MDNFYDLFMKGFEDNGLRHERKKLIKKASGQVLEIGSGTGANLEFYNLYNIEELYLSDYKITDILKSRANKLPKEKLHLKDIDVTSLPFKDDCFDTIVFTLVFCSVNDIEKGLKEVKRVLKSDGKLIFIEHVIPEAKYLKILFNFATPLWKRVASGCHLNRDFLKSIEEYGFTYKLENRLFKTSFISGIAKIDVR